jgi:hypothetical protein
MNLKVEHGIIAILLIAFLYYFYTHQSLLSDLSLVPHEGNQQLKAVKKKHTLLFNECSTIGCGDECVQCPTGLQCEVQTFGPIIWHSCV